MGDNREELNYEKKLSELIHSIIFKDTAEIRRYNFIAENCVANAYAHLQMPDSALYYELLAYEEVLKIKSGTSVGLALTTSNIGEDYSMMGNDDSAFFFFRMSIPFALQSQRRDIVAGAQLGMAALFNKKGQSDSAFFYSRQSLKVLQSTDDPAGLADTYSLLSKLYQGTHQFDSAYKYLQLFDIMKDSLNNQNKIKQAQNLSFNETLKQQQLDQAKIEERQQYESKIKGYIFIAIILVFLIIGFLLLRNNRNKRKANILLSKQKEQIENTLSELKSTQKQLIHSEKMASLGELTAGIAHEIQNPLNFVNNFSDINKELVDELQTEIKSGNTEGALSISSDIKENEEKINHHGQRAGDIVKGMLQHSRSSAGVKEPTDINAFVDEYLRLSYQGLRAKDKSFNAKMETDFDESIGKINIIPQDIGRVLLNLYNNAFYAVQQKVLAKEVIPFQKVSPPYEPTVSVTTKKSDNNVLITVSDNGNGIPQKIVDKIFQPFFTTKPTGQGTGLGLSLSYDIIKAHGGEIKVEAVEGEARPPARSDHSGGDDPVGRGTRFIISLPLS